MERSEARYNLLFGLLALRRGLVDQDTLVEAHFAWLDDGRRLDHALVQRGVIDEATRAVIAAEFTDPARDSESTGHDATADASDTVGTVSTAGVAETEDGEETEGSLRSTLGGGDTDGGRRRGVDCGRYRDLRFHAEGGMGVVYLARDVELGREVAVKRIRGSRADDRGYQGRFCREAEITGRLEHPGVVPVYGLNRSADNRPYYAMKLVGGVGFDRAIADFHRAEKAAPPPAAPPGLASTVARTGPAVAEESRGGRLSSPETADFTLGDGGEGSARATRGERELAFRKLLRRFVDLCNTIDYAHSRGVIHRDLKPSNVRLGDFGETIVLDWGLAKRKGAPEDAPGSGRRAAPDADADPPLTIPDTALGTIGYMSPEQARGDLDAVGFASDVYGLGAVLYHLLTGRPTIGAVRKEVGLSRTVRGDFPRPRAVRAAVPRALESVCLKALALAPADRYADVRGLIDDVEHWLGDEPVSVHREGAVERLSRLARRHRDWTRAGAAALAVAAVVSTVAAFQIDRAYRSEQRAYRNAEAGRLVAVAARQTAEANLELAREAVRARLSVYANLPLAAIPLVAQTRASLARKARDFSRYFLRVRPDDPEVREDAIITFRDAGKIASLTGDLGQAAEDYGEAVALARGLTHDLPDLHVHALRFAELCLDLGSVQASMGRYDEVRKHLREGLASVARLRKANPEHLDYGRIEFFLRAELARCELDTGHYEEARRGYAAVESFFRPLAAREPAVIHDVWFLAIALRGLGVIAREGGGPRKEAIPYFEEVKTLLKGKDDETSSLMFASAFDQIGLTLAGDSDRLADAEASFTQALKNLDDLRRRQPRYTPFLREWAVACNGRGSARAALGKSRWDDARADFAGVRDALKERLGRPDFHPTPVDRVQYALALAGLGRLERAGGNPDAARGLLREAEALLKKVHDGNASDPVTRRALDGVRGDLQTLEKPAAPPPAGNAPRSDDHRGGRQPGTDVVSRFLDNRSGRDQRHRERGDRYGRSGRYGRWGNEHDRDRDARDIRGYAHPS